MTGSSVTTGDIADKLGTTPRALRKFLRSPDSPFEAVGQGARYNFDEGDLEELKNKFEAWADRPGSRSTSTSAPTQRKKNKRSSKPADRVNPLDADSLAVRLGSSIADRQRAHGLICAYSEKHPKVKDLDVKCSELPDKGSRFCGKHTQIKWCYTSDAEPLLCGPEFHKPFCEYHEAEIGDDEIDAMLETETGKILRKNALLTLSRMGKI